MDGMLGLFVGAIGLGVLHGMEPGHGWPVAAAWAASRPRRRRAGLIAALVIGLGHLLSSIAVVLLFFAARAQLDFGASGWLDWVAGGLLLLLAAWQLRSALGSGHHHGNDHHEHHPHDGEPTVRSGLGALAVFAITLGFAHSEEFQIIALCTGSYHCVALMLVYTAAVIAVLVALTLLLLAGLRRFGHHLRHAERTLTLLSAAILALMGIGFLAGLF